MKTLVLVSFLTLIILSPGLVSAASFLDIIINEIAWMGGEVSYNDEWIELYNNTDSTISLEGWVLKAADGTPEIKLTRTVLANGFWVLKRSEDYTGALHNRGEKLELYDNQGNLIDSVDCSLGWLAGDNFTKQTMERKTDANWQTSKEPGGTPGAENSQGVEIKLQPTEDHPPAAATLPHPAAQSNNWLVGLVAILVAIFSGIIILVLKKKLKMNYNK